MGSSQSSSVRQTVEILNQSMTNLVNSKTSSASANNTNTNSYSISVGKGASVKNCRLKLGQKINAKQAVKVMAKFQNLNDLKTQMETALKNSIDQASKSEQQALATSLNVQNSKQEIDQKVRNIVETNVKNETLEKLDAFLDNVNKGDLVILGDWDCGTEGPIEIDQEIVSDQIVELLTDTMIGNSITNTTKSETAAESKQTSESKQTGVIGDFFNGISNVFSGPFKFIAIACIAVAVIGLIGIVIKMSLSKKEAEKVSQEVSNFFGFGRKRARFGKRRW